MRLWGVLFLPFLFGIGGLHEEKQCEAGEEGDEAVEGLGAEEGAAALGEEGDGGVAVLGDAAGDEDREWDDSGGVEGHEDEVRTGLGNDAYEGGEEDHQGGVITDPMLNINELQAYPEDEEDAESPCENRREVLPDDVAPEVVLNEMVGREEKYEEDNDAEAGEEDVHPVFAQQVDLESFRFGSIFNTVEEGITFAGMFMNTCFRMLMPTGFRAAMLMPVMPVMRAVVVAEVAGGEGGDEGGEADEHRDAFESVGPFLPRRAPTGRATMRVVGGRGVGG